MSIESTNKIMPQTPDNPDTHDAAVAVAEASDAASEVATDATEVVPSEPPVPSGPKLYIIGKDVIKWQQESFDEMDLPEKLLRGIYSTGWETPSVIQGAAISVIMEGVDTIAQSQSGTGKTGTFLIGLLASMDPTQNRTQALVLAPTRELAQQIAKTALQLGNKIRNLRINLSVGGVNVRQNMDELRRSPQLVIGTPGRVYDMIQRQALDTRYIKQFCLDEADQMLDYGFKPQVQKIFGCLNEDVQTILFSATMPEAVREITNEFMRQPATHLLLESKRVSLEGINQFHIKIEEDYKLSTLEDLWGELSITQCLIFCNTRQKIEWLHDQLEKSGHAIISIHGQMTQQERERLLCQFRSGEARIMIASDMLARGIDIQTISLVVNYDFPRDRENYIHRIGRAGRFGRKGTAINLVTRRDERSVSEIERFYGTKIQELPQNFKEML